MTSICHTGDLVYWWDPEVDDWMAVLEGIFRSAGEVIGYSGLDPLAASVIAGQAGTPSVRVIDMQHQLALRTDSRPGRLNLIVQDGRVVRAFLENASEGEGPAPWTASADEGCGSWASAPES